MLDFTLSAYSELLNVILHQGFNFTTYANYVQNVDMRTAKTVVLRHDVDLSPRNSLLTAELECKLGICGTYYFRAVPESWDEDIIMRIANLGHEVGYHYECLTTCKGDMAKAYDDFCLNLERLRKLALVKTICMHGSPRSPYDSKNLWKEYDYKKLGLVAEPYIDTDFSKMFYLTDTGRCWDGFKVSVRDKIEGYQDRWIEQGLVFHSTADVVGAAKVNRLPERIMFTVHPQRWNDFGIAWLRELVSQNLKNVVKAMLVNRDGKIGRQYNAISAP